MLLLSAASDLPTFKLSCTQGHTPQKCLNQKVTLDAKMAGYDRSSASMVMQHPDLRPPMGNWYQSQTMLSSNLGQMNVLSQKPITCPQVRLVGRLTRYQLGCGPGQHGKCEYASYVIDVDKFTCLNTGSKP